MITKWDDETIAKARRILGDVDDSKLMEILALEPSLNEIEEAVLKIQGLGGLHGHDKWPLEGKAGTIFDILAADLEDELRNR